MHLKIFSLVENRNLSKLKCCFFQQNFRFDSHLISSGNTIDNKGFKIKVIFVVNVVYFKHLQC